MAKVTQVTDAKAQGSFDRANFDGIFVQVDSDEEGKIAKAIGYSVEGVSIGGTGENLFHLVVPQGAKGDQKGYTKTKARLIIRRINKIMKEVKKAPKI